MGLLDNFFGGGDPNQSLYGDALTPEQLAALRQRGLLGFLGGMQKSGALDSTIPTLTGRMPGSFASGLAAGAGGMGEAMDAGALNAMRAQQLGLQTQQLRSQLTMRDKLMGALPGLLGGGDQGAQPGAVPAVAPQQASSDPALDTAVPGDNWEVTHNNFGGLRIPGSTAGPKAGGFQAFASPEDGVAAISRQLDRYASGATTGTPLTTIRQIVSTWAPPSENPTTALVDRASKVVGADPDKPLDLSDPVVKAKLIEATIRNEQGGKLPIDPALIVKVAQAGPAAPALTVGGGLLGGGASPSATSAAPSGLLPPAGSAAQPSPTLTNGINPRNLAAAGVYAGLGGIGDAFKPIEQYYYNSPGYLHQKALAEGTGKGQADLQFAGPVAGAKRTAENAADLTGKPMIFRPGSGVGTAATGPISAMPTMTDIVNPDGSTSKVPINPLTGQRYTPPGGAGSPASPQAAATAATSGLKTKLDPATEKSLEHAGTDDAKMYNDYRAMFLSNQSAKQDLTNAMEALQYVRSGAGAELTNDVAKALRAMHIDVSNFVTLPQPAQLEIVQKASGRLLGGAVKSVVGNNRPALGEFDYLKNTVVNTEGEPEAQRAVASALLSTMNWQDQLFKEMQAHRKANNGSPVGFDVADYGARNPMPQFYGDALQSFAPLKGEVPLPQHPGVPSGGAPGSPAAPRRGAYNPRTGQIEWQ